VLLILAPLPCRQARLIAAGGEPCVLHGHALWAPILELHSSGQFDAPVALPGNEAAAGFGPEPPAPRLRAPGPIHLVPERKDPRKRSLSATAALGRGAGPL
jgi:hypothetical protein